MDKGSRWVTVHGVTKGQTQLKEETFLVVIHAWVGVSSI